MHRQRNLRTIIALAALACVGIVHVARADEPASIMMVLDGSNSMNGRIAGDANPKHVLVREALRRSLPKIDSATKIGITSFGHRRQADCSDAEVLLTPRPADPIQTLAPLEKFTPKGYSPVVLALREAAKATAGQKGAASLVLVLDDLASCREDPCIAAAEITKAYPKMPVHVVGLGLKPDDVQRLTCLPAQTGGRLYLAQDAAALSVAIEQVLTFASLAGGAPSIAGKVSPPAGQPGATLPSATEPGLSLAVALADGGSPISQPVRWRVSREGAEPHETIADQVAPTLDLATAPGRYLVELRVGLIAMERRLDVAAEPPVRLTIGLSAASLSVAAPLQKGGKPSPSASFAIFRTGSTEPMVLAQATVEDLILPAGSYRLVAEDGLARSERTVDLAAGNRLQTELPLTAGRLRLEASLARGEPLKDRVQFTVHEDDPESPGGRREITRSAAAQPEFVLPAGAYHIAVRRGTAEARERILIRAGDELTKALSITVARVQLATRMAGTGAWPTEAVSYRVERLDGGAQEIARTGATEPILELSAGLYRIQSRLGGQNAIASREVDLKAGSEQRIVLEQPAGDIRFRLKDAKSGLVFGDVFWEVTEPGGKPVWRTGIAEPRMVLAAGKYMLRVEFRGRVLDHTIEVRAGETRTVEIDGS